MKILCYDLFNIFNSEKRRKPALKSYREHISVVFQKQHTRHFGLKGTFH